MGLLGHLDSQGLDSEVLALTRTSLWYALAGSFEAADQDCSPVEKHLQAVARQLAC